jgi:hypothetical protein
MREFKQDASYRVLQSMLMKDLDAYRKKNDTAEGNVVYRNQGVCQYLKTLLKDLGFDSDKKPVVYDGAFD